MLYILIISTACIRRMGKVIFSVCQFTPGGGGGVLPQSHILSQVLSWGVPQSWPGGGGGVLQYGIPPSQVRMGYPPSPGLGYLSPGQDKTGVPP